MTIHKSDGNGKIKIVPNYSGKYQHAIVCGDDGYPQNWDDLALCPHKYTLVCQVQSEVDGWRYNKLCKELFKGAKVELQHCEEPYRQDQMRVVVVLECRDCRDEQQQEQGEERCTT